MREEREPREAGQALHPRDALYRDRQQCSAITYFGLCGLLEGGLILMKRYRIKIIITTPTVELMNYFDLKDYNSPEEWIKAAKDWIRKDEE
jgi:hypothetical protein